MVASLLIAVSASWYWALLALFAASAFSGLGLQQYAWYTTRVYSECWADEGIAVVALVALASALLALISLVLWLLMPRLLCLLVVGGLHLALLSSCRWAFWGSLFDGYEKRRDESALAAMKY